MAVSRDFSKNEVLREFNAKQGVLVVYHKLLNGEVFDDLVTEEAPKDDK